MSIAVGDPAPAFTLPDESGAPVSLADFKGKKVVIYFYPKDDTPGCTKEACNFRDRWDRFQANGIKVLGISKDPAASHAKFIKKYELPFTLLTDADPCPVASAFGSYGLKKFMGKEYMGVFRTTFLIDENGKIAKVYEGVKPAEHSAEILADLRS